MCVDCLLLFNSRFDIYDPPLKKQENLDLPYFDGYDFVNSSWTIYVRHKFGAWNWLDRMGYCYYCICPYSYMSYLPIMAIYHTFLCRLVPQATQRVFLRGDGKTMVLPMATYLTHLFFVIPYLLYISLLSIVFKLVKIFETILFVVV